jgi:hypothetical protein
MAQRSSQQGGEGLSLQTLVIAALAAGAAAVITSYFWQKGTLISAAMTPVIVTVLSEMLKRPAQTARRVASTARSATPARARERERLPLAHGAGAGSPVEGPSRELPAPREPSPARFSEIKVYRSEGDGSGGRRFGRIHWKIVLATAGIAFVIAVGALTLPELLFGSSVSGSNNTTFFGGSSRAAKKTDDNTKTTTTDKQKTDTDQQKTVTEQQTTTVQTTTAPTQSTPQQQTPQSVAPQQQQAPQSTPVPAQPSAPSEQPAPQGQTTTP